MVRRAQRDGPARAMFVSVWERLSPFQEALWACSPPDWTSEFSRTAGETPLRTFVRPTLLGRKRSCWRIVSIGGV